MTRTAIVSMSCLFPGATSPEEFWQELLAGTDLRTELEELPEVGPEDRQHRIRTRRGGFVREPRLNLDGLALPLAELAGLDRVFTWPVHVVREALESVAKLDRSRTGVVLGNYTFPTTTSRSLIDPLWQGAVADGLRAAGLTEDLLPPLVREVVSDADAGLELAPGGLPARVVSAALGLGGPSFCLDAACASSLYAVNLAIRRLAAGEVDAMVAGGVCVPDEELIHLCFSDLQAYPTDGQSQPFDAGSRGILTGQGAAVVVLKRLEDALRDGDDVLAVIEGVGVSNDGRGRHLLAPSLAGQVRAYEDAYAKSGSSPDSVAYVECHATGTPLGDRTELQGLGDFWVDRHGTSPLYGTVKPNVSHLLTVAGMSSLIKVVQSIRHGVIPPTIGVNDPLEDPRLTGRLVREVTAWPGDGIRRAGISSFGFGGTNAHLVLSNDTTQWPAENKTPRPRLALTGIGLATGNPDAITSLRTAQRSGKPVASEVAETRLRGLVPLVDKADRAIDEFAADPLGMRIPPKDLTDFNTQHLTLMNAARDCLIDAGLDPDVAEPRRIAVVIASEMELDAHGHGVRFRLGEQLRSWLVEAGVETDEVERIVTAAQDGIHDGLSANEVLSYIGNLMASRIASRWNLIGPTFTVSGDATVSIDAIEIAGDLLRDGDVDGVLVAAVDLATTVSALGGSFLPAYGAADGATAIFLTEDDTTARTYAVVEATARTPQAALDQAGWKADAVGLLDVTDAASLKDVFSEEVGETGLTSTAALSGDSRIALPLTAIAASALAMYDATLPATPAQLDIENLPAGLRVGADSRPWLRTSDELGRRALVVSTGHGTTSAVALSGADVRGDDPALAAWGGTDVPLLVPLMGNSIEQVASRAAKAAEDLKAGRTSVAELAREGKAELAAPTRHRLVVIGRDADEVARELESAGKGLVERVAGGHDWATPAGSFLAAQPIGAGKVAFVFPGAFNSYVGMGRDLFDAFPALVPEFETATRRPAGVLRVDQLHPRGQKPLERRDLMRLDNELLEDIPFMLASGTSTSLLHTMLLEKILGVRADGAFGYSLGESSMMFAMGGWDPAARDDGRISDTELFRTGLTGPMSVVRNAWGLDQNDDQVWATYVVLADPAEVKKALETEAKVFLTHVNSPREVVISGDPKAVAALIERLGARAARAPANHVMHCPVVDPVLDELAELNRYPTQSIGPELLSAFDYERVPDLGSDEVADRIAHTLRSTIDFPRLINTAYDRGYRYFIEVGPGGSCTRWVGDSLSGRPHVAVALDRRGTPAARSVVAAAARLLSHGVDVDVYQLLDRIDPPEPRPSVPLICGGAPVPAAVHANAGDLSSLRRTISLIPIQEGPPVNSEASPPLRRTATAKALPLRVNAPAATETIQETQVDEIEEAVALLRKELEASEEFLRLAGLPVEATWGDGGSPQEPARSPKPEGVIFDHHDLTTFAVGAIADVFGPEYAKIDTFSRRVRLPAAPYHFVTRVTALDAKLGERGTASITTEYDVPADAWYATDGQVPPAVTIEAGQCDLLLASFLGIDLENRGERVYRLLDSSLTFHGDLPKVGQTLRYDIVIDKWIKTPGPTLFNFRYKCYADGELIVELTNGCAGFFTDAELEASSGVIKPKRLDDKVNQRRFTPLARPAKTTLNRDDVRRLSAGDIVGVFGPDYAQGEGINPSVRLAPEELLMVDDVDQLTTSGGRFGLGGIVARKQLQPDGWYFTSHFTDDHVLPGSLVAEGAVQLLQIHAMALGLHLVFPDARFQPVGGVTTAVQVRGQMLPKHPELRYEVDIKEVGLLPRPHIVADVTVYVEGKASVSIVDLAIGVAEKPGTPYAPGDGGVVEHFLGRRNRNGEAALLSEFHMAHAAKGDLAIAMGTEFGVYANSRAPYIPNGDFLFVDRVMALEGTRGDLKPGAVMETEYDVPVDAWYLADNGADIVPNCVLMESSLQSAILLGYYLGATLPFPEQSFRIRNLDGTASFTRSVDLRGKTIRQRSVLLASIPMPGSVLQKFSYELSTEGEVFYRGESMFGYFVDEALTQQLGLDKGGFVPPWIEGRKTVGVRSRTLANFARTTPGAKTGNLDVAGAMDLVLDGGAEGRGYVFGTRDIETEDWYFRCHFHTDPVMPGSLGVEAMIGALEAFALEFGLADGITDPVFAPAVDVPFTWSYRGQIPHEAMEMSYELHVTDVRREADRVVVIARGSLWRPGLRIYDLDGLAIEIRSAGKELA